MEDLRHVQRNEVFGELSKVLADAMQRSVLAVPGWISFCSWVQHVQPLTPE